MPSDLLATERTKVSHRVVGKSERAGGGVRHDAVTTTTRGADVEWPHCEKCGRRRFTGGAQPPSPHGVQVRNRGDGTTFRIDCLGDEILSNE
jgi:hypothetical protein